MFRCHYCSAELPEKAAFCSTCGQSTGSGSEIPTLTSDQPFAAAIRQSRSEPVDGTSSIGPLNLPPGAVVSERYRILGILGRGGMGMVYKADDMKLGQVVALKFLPTSFTRDPVSISRFLAEVRIARQVSHPNVCRVYDINELNGHHFLTMEYVDGEDLAALLARIGRLSKTKALELAHELCAGLAAAHAKNVVHRDLKPANVMIDGRGHARITDFGLAVGAGENTTGELAGTPAYMAPELFDGRQATVQTDLYALGLVLYELHTGKRPWEGRSFDEWRKHHSKTPPTLPSSQGLDLDPVVERLILSCLEKNPVMRPRSALQVAAALPGSNPLAAAIAAGETPSPEMVAAAGEEGSLSIWKAWSLLAAVATGLILIVFLSQHSSLPNLLPIVKSPEVLSEQARQIAAKLGYANSSADEGHWFDLDPAYDRYSSRISAPLRYRGVGDEFPFPLEFWYRQSPYALQTHYPFTVTATNPVSFYSGEWRIGMDSAARLNYFAAIGPQEDATADQKTPDWQTVFTAADLDLQQSHALEAKRLPDVPSDKSFAWETFSHGKRLQIQGASYHNKIVFFHVSPPWEQPERVGPTEGTFASRIGIAFFVATIFVLLAAGFLFARRNLKQGRGDLPGAIRVAAVIFAVLLVGQALITHYALDAEWIFIWFLLSSGLAMTNALQFVLLYMALEPYVRRTWPEILISWSRLVAGNWKSPLVGRDVLIGVLFGVGMLVANYTRVTLPYWFSVPDITVAWSGSWREASVFFGNLASNIFALMDGIGSLAVVFLVTKITRSKIAALIFAGLFGIAINLFGENLRVEIVVASVLAILWLTCLMRVGLLAICVCRFVLFTLTDGLCTFDLSRWYAWRGLVELAVVAAITLYGFRVSIGNKSLFGTMLEN
jgi:serine/threonine protein kinase